MKKLFTSLLSTLPVIPMFTIGVSAATHTVASGDTLWKLANRYQVGLSEIKSTNPQIQNYDLIYPGQIINIPTTDTAVTDFEQEVIRLVNKVRAENGLKTLSYDWQLSPVAIIGPKCLLELEFLQKCPGA